VTVEDLVRWLGEQLDEDERIAREAAAEWGTAWAADHDTDTVDSAIEYVSVVGEPNSPIDFIAEWDPARVLREVDSKRRVIGAIEHLLVQVDDPFADVDDMLRLLALPYTDRPGYLDSWRP
jgi:hypothetical protein